MPFDAVKCTVEFRNGFYTLNVTVRYLDANGAILAMKPVSATVAKAGIPAMRNQLVNMLQAILDQAVLDLQEEVTGETGLATNVLTQINTYLATKG